DNIARVMVQSLADYFGIPMIEPTPEASGMVTADGSNLNIRKFPSISSEIIGSIPDGAVVKILGETGGWYVVYYDSVTGYASAAFIRKE
ncbi:MAG: SH3 domain-containing protein, partial [Oscillospiraceae bacterium]